MAESEIAMGDFNRIVDYNDYGGPRPVQLYATNNDYGGLSGQGGVVNTGGGGVAYDYTTSDKGPRKRVLGDLSISSSHDSGCCPPVVDPVLLAAILAGIAGAAFFLDAVIMKEIMGRRKKRGIGGAAVSLDLRYQYIITLGNSGLDDFFF